MGARTEQKEETQALIVAAARELFEEQHARDVRVKDIAERAGVAVGSVFFHHGSRAGLLGAVAGSAWDDLAARLPMPEDKCGLLAALEAFFATHDLPLARVLWRVGDELSWGQPDATEPASNALRQWIAGHLRAEGRPGRDAELLADLITPGMLFTGRRLVVNEAPEELAERFLASVRATLGHWPAGKRRSGGQKSTES